MIYSQKFSRRKMIKFMALSVAVPIMTPLVSKAQTAKTSKESMQYQEEPKGKEQCSNCMQFIPGKTSETNGECKVVEGNISPQGWCSAYVPKP